MSQKLIGLGNLFPADIIVETTSAHSRMIRFSTGGDVSHAILYCGRGKVIEAVEDGVRETSYGESIKGANYAIALRYHGLSHEKRLEIIANARSFLNRKYDYPGAFGSLNGSRGRFIYLGACVIAGLLPCLYGSHIIAKNATEEHADDKFFCSELVARAYEMAGLKIVNESPSYTNPYMIQNSSQLRYVGLLRDRKNG